MADYTTLFSEDDANEVVSTGAMDITAKGTTTAAKLDGSRHGGFRIPSVTISNGASIAVATLYFERLYNYSSLGATISNTTLYGQASDDAPVFTTTTSNISSRSRTTHTGILMDDTATAGGASHNADVTDIVQEIVNRSGWVSGNAMAFLFIGNGTAGSNWIQPYMWDYFSGFYKTYLSITLAGATTTSTSTSTSQSTSSTSSSTSYSTSSTSTSSTSSSTSTSTSTTILDVRAMGRISTPSPLGAVIKHRILEICLQ